MPHFQPLVPDTPPLPADPQATPETRALYRNLFRIADEGVMFGHQDDVLYGHDWKYEEGRSDVRECCGDYPAVFGWELGGLETGADRSIDDVPFAEITRLLCAAYGRGAVNTVSWHPQESRVGASAWDGKNRHGREFHSPGRCQPRPIPAVARPSGRILRRVEECRRNVCSGAVPSVPRAHRQRILVGRSAVYPRRIQGFYGASRWNICAM